MNIVTTIEEFFAVSEQQKEQLAAMNTPQLMKDFVLPHCLGLPRSGVRYPRISGSFMKLMTRHGGDFLTADYKIGSILLELAMQRITRHPDLPAIDYKGNLPEAYKPYAASSVNLNGINCCPDEPGLWGSEEVHFLLEMLPVCLTLRDRLYADHAKLILFQMVSMLGTGTFMWLDDIRYCDVREKDAWKSACDVLFATNLVREFIDYCVGKGWRSGMNFFRLPRFYGQDEEYLLNKIDLDKETYYRGSKRLFLKLFGLYNKFTRKRIAEELHNQK